MILIEINLFSQIIADLEKQLDCLMSNPLIPLRVKMIRGDAITKQLQWMLEQHLKEKEVRREREKARINEEAQMKGLKKEYKGEDLGGLFQFWIEY